MWEQGVKSLGNHVWFYRVQSEDSDELLQEIGSLGGMTNDLVVRGLCELSALLFPHW